MKIGIDIDNTITNTLPILKKILFSTIAVLSLQFLDQGVQLLLFVIIKFIPPAKGSHQHIDRRHPHLPLQLFAYSLPVIFQPCSHRIIADLFSFLYRCGESLSNNAAQDGRLSSHSQCIWFIQFMAGYTLRVFPDHLHIAVFRRG